MRCICTTLNTCDLKGRAAAAAASTERNSLAIDAAQAKQAPPPKVHWSALEPISSNKVHTMCASSLLWWILFDSV
jgi:hypothetical protein